LTEKKDESVTAVNFFREVLVPTAEALRSEGKSFFPLQADPLAESYFVEPTRRVMTHADFELRAAESLEDFVKELAALWTAEGHDELAAMAPRLLEIFVQEREQPLDEDELSPFLYAMY
jgi:hypothetical protein